MNSCPSFCSVCLHVTDPGMLLSLVFPELQECLRKNRCHLESWGTGDTAESFVPVIQATCHHGWEAHGSLLVCSVVRGTKLLHLRKFLLKSVYCSTYGVPSLRFSGILT